jgi:hypothetical protein
MSTSTALVTGANGGIGFHIARQLAEQGWTVLVGARDLARGSEAAAQFGGRPLLLDVTDADTIAAAAAAVPDLDVLVNNAGISLDTGALVTETDVEAFRRTYETNVFGVLAVTNAFLPALRRSPHPRIVNTSSGTGRAGACRRSHQGQRARARRAGHEPQCPCGIGRRRPSRSGGGCRSARPAPGRRPHRSAVLLGRDGRAVVNDAAGDLPMAPDGCTLDDSGLGEQLDRYRRLAAHAVTVQDGDAELVIEFGAGIDIDLLDKTVAIERRCCSFFRLGYDASTRQLSIGIDDPARGDALAVLASVLRDSWGRAC